MLQNILVTALTPLQNVDEINCLDNRPFSGVWFESKRDISTEIKKTIKKKPKRIRTAYTTEQLRALETWFTQNKYITSERRREISKVLNIGDKSVKIWFQNRRMKEKRESSESSSDSSNEAFVCETSPPLVDQSLATKCQHSDQIIGDTNRDPKHLISSESRQYQLPQYFYNSNEQPQTSLASNNNIIRSNGMQFYTDSNLYPPQYYQYNDNHYFNDYNYHQYQQENAMYEYNNYFNWSLNNGGSSYF